MKVIFCTPSVEGPTKPYIKALEDSIPVIVSAGWTESYAQYVGNPYISYARNDMTRRALDQKPDAIVYLDYDLSWKPQDLLTLINTPGDFVAGTYRYKKDEEEYMGAIETNSADRPIVRPDGCLRAHSMPAGFLKLTVEAIRKLMRAYPELNYGDPEHPTPDLFNHGAHKWSWYGEDMALCRRWRDIGGEIWNVPNLDITHHSKDKAYPGNFHYYLLRQPGGRLHEESGLAANV